MKNALSSLKMHFFATENGQKSYSESHTEPLVDSVVARMFERYGGGLLRGEAASLVATREHL